MNTRCHRCGVVITAADTVRREMVVSRTGYLKQIGMVDLCAACVRELDRQKRQANRAHNRQMTILAIAVPIAAFLILCWFFLLSLIFKLGDGAGRSGDGRRGWQV